MGLGDHRSATAAKLLGAAEALVVERGITGLSVRKVGERAGLNPTLVTYHFGGISGLLDELCERNIAPILTAWEGLDDCADMGLDAVLRLWLLPLQNPAAYTPKGRALIVLDEIGAHGEGELRGRVLRDMEGFSRRLRGVLAPICLHLEEDELRARMRFISAAILGPPPRMHGAPATSNGMMLDSPEFLLRFAKAALEN